MASEKMQIDRERAKNYTKHSVKIGDKTRRSVDNADEVAELLRGKTDEELGHIAKKHGLAEKWTEWAGLNPGQRRMSLGNVLRGQRRRAEKEAAAAAAKEAEGAQAAAE